MQQATELIKNWMGTDETKYAQLVFHPGLGVPGFQIRLYEVNGRSPSGSLMTRCTVTEKGVVEEAGDLIRLALSRWANGDFDPISQGPVQGDSGGFKKVEI